MTTAHANGPSHNFSRIDTPCPACGHATLFVAIGGHLTCSWLKCPEPSVERWIVQVKEAIGKLAADFLP